jgi:phytoene desaturase
MKGTRVVVVGAGVGGLAAAARLARQGFQVDVYEQASAPGGRCGELTIEGYRWDVGPTLLLMPEVVEETFCALGRRMEEYLTLVRCEPNYRVHFRDGTRLSLGGNREALAREVEALEPGAFARVEVLLARAQEMYDEALGRFVGRNFDHLGQFLTPANLWSMLRIHALGRLYPWVARHVRDDRLRAALTFQTMYLGISPFEAPGVYGLLAHAELQVGVYHPQGGLYALVRALARLCEEEGVRIHYRQRVERIQVEHACARGVTLKGGGHAEADVVLCNADLPWAYEHLLAGGRALRRRKLRFTSSGFVLYWGLDREVPELLRHNVFLGRDYRGSFEDLFRRQRVPEDPSFYVNVPSRGDFGSAPPGKDALYVLVPVPSLSPEHDWAAQAPVLRAKVFRRLAEEGLPGLEQQVVVERQLTPRDWQETFHLARGSAFGLAHNFFQIGPFRPPNQDPQVRNLFFVGASTQPGTGLPTVMVSARLVVERIQAHLRQVMAREKSRSRREAARV